MSPLCTALCVLAALVITGLLAVVGVLVRIASNDIPEDADKELWNN